MPVPFQYFKESVFFNEKENLTRTLALLSQIDILTF